MERKTTVPFFDFEKSGFMVFAEYIAMMGLWVFIGHYAARGLVKLGNNKRKEQRN